MAETVIGYVYDEKGYHDDGQYFEGTMENIASFISTTGMSCIWGESP